MSLLLWDNLNGARGVAGIPTANAPIAGWMPAPNGGTWTARAATSTFGSTANSLTTTGSTTANFATFDPANAITYWSTNVVVEFSMGAGDACGVLARFQNLSNYYRADQNNGTFQLVKNVAGTVTTLPGGTAFADGGANYKIRFLCVGFGLDGTLNNLIAKIWLSSNAESTATIIAALDTSLLARGEVGVRMKGGLAAHIQSLFNFTAQSADHKDVTGYATPPYNVTNNLPIGSTTLVLGNSVMLQQTLLDMALVGNGFHNRFQEKWQNVEFAPGQFDWTLMDDCVWRCNKLGIPIFWPIQSPPTFRQTLDGYGNPGVLSAAIGIGVTSVPVTALPAGCYIPDTVALSLGFGTANVETVHVSNGGIFVGAGATSIPIAAPTTKTHSGGDVCIDAGGFQFAAAQDWVNFVTLAATRYNGLNGYGKVDWWGIENENYDAANRIGTQVVLASWTGNSAWDNGGAILAPVYSACRTAIQAIIPGAPVIPCSVRKSPLSALTHIVNWSRGFAQNVTTKVDGFDFHYYRDGTNNPDGTPITDPSQPTYSDLALTQVNAPTTEQEVVAILAVYHAFGLTPFPIAGEYGWDMFDDGTGLVFTMNGALTAGVPITALTVLALGAQIPDATPLYVDTGGTNPEGPFYAYGTTNAGLTTVQITSDIRGKAATNNPQVAFTPTFSHGASVAGYAQKGVTVIIPLALDQQYDAYVTNTLIKYGGYAFRYTMQSNAVVTSTPIPASSNFSKSDTQTIGGVYTYLPTYFKDVLQTQQFLQGQVQQPVSVWSGITSPPPVSGSRRKLNDRR